ncbi:MAG: CRISPR-associated endonuclease Cas2 [Methanothrix sp.]|nr:CRISPR-associated endonuclease Cas2 [Methanothrix sp.]
MNSLNCYVVSYDIREQKRLCRVRKAMLGFGEPVHYSVFICHLSAMGRVELIAALTDLIDAEKDRIMIIDMGPADGRVEERIIFLGVHEEKMEPGGKLIIV